MTSVSGAPAPVRDRKILVVDDDSHCRTSLTFFLKAKGFQPIEADDGAIALTTFGAERPALVLADVLLPKVSGFEICRSVKSAGGSSTPVILMSAVYRRSDLNRQVLGQFRADDYLVKPVDPQDLVRRIERHLAPPALVLPPPLEVSIPEIGLPLLPHLSGSFDGDGLPRLFWNLSQHLETGVLTLEARGESRKVFFLQGHPAYATGRGGAARSGREEVLGILLDAFAWPGGEYRYERDRSFAEFLPSFHFDPLTVVEEGIRRYFDLGRLRGVLAPLGSHPLAPGPNTALVRDRLASEPLWERLLREADGKRTADAAVAASGLAVTQALQVLLVLLTVGALRTL